MSIEDKQKEILEGLKEQVRNAVKDSIDTVVEGKAKKKGYMKDEEDMSTNTDNDSDDEDDEGEDDEESDSMNEEEDPCWDGYEQYGTKKKNGKTVPNCVKKKTK